MNVKSCNLCTIHTYIRNVLFQSEKKKKKKKSQYVCIVLKSKEKKIRQPGRKKAMEGEGHGRDGSFIISARNRECMHKLRCTQILELFGFI